MRVRLESGPGSPHSAELFPEGNGYFSGAVPGAAAGTDYRFALDDAGLFPDPASRFQPEGPHGPSRVIDPSSFTWSDHAWPGLKLPGQIIYEMHIGTFSWEGTWRGAREELAELAAARITAVEVMPVAEFPGRFGWGYDGVDLFAPTRLYGEPDDLREFVDHAHALGLGVILDVVYNHLGPDGNYLAIYSRDYFTDRYNTPWGAAVNFDGENSGPVREFVTTNARYWINEFHFDGLRLDATHAIWDNSEEHILKVIGREARAGAQGRSILVTAEHELTETRLVRPASEGGYELDAVWNDDFHHTARVALTDRSDGYYSEFSGTPQEFVSSAKYGPLFQGQWHRWRKQRSGMPAFGMPPAAFVNFIQNHDQVANSARGERPSTLTTPAKYRAMTALLLLGPATPMLFQGQEFGATTPFLYFCDHGPELAELVREGRAQFLAEFGSLALPEMQAVFPDPGDPQTFESSKLDFRERERNAQVYDLHKDLIALRKSDPVFASQRAGGIDGAVLGGGAFVLRYFGGANGDRLLVINLGGSLRFDPAPEPLLAPPAGKEWRVLWSTEDPRYGGLGMLPPDTDEGWRIPGNAAVVLAGQTARPSALPD